MGCRQTQFKFKPCMRLIKTKNLAQAQKKINAPEMVLLAGDTAI